MICQLALQVDQESPFSCHFLWSPDEDLKSPGFSRKKYGLEKLLNHGFNSFKYLGLQIAFLYALDQ